MKPALCLRLWLISILLILVLVGGCSTRSTYTADSFNSQLAALVKPYTFNYAAWEFKSLSHELSLTRLKVNKNAASDAAAVVSYFSGGADRDNQAVKDRVEKILAYQISQVLADLGIYNPFIGFHFTFPPVNFRLENPPNILIISPRDKIERMRDLTLKQAISPDEMAELESEIEQLNVSALVIPIGGLGATYPSFVEETSDLKFTVDVIAEEWLHQYLAFKPLGFRYVLDLLRIKPDSDMESLNETVAGLAGQEIGDLVYARYYAPYPQKQVGSSGPAAFDYNTAMRETRLTVDSFLAAGQVEQAESYMKQRCQFINSHGYHIRKLNQAYFAFYGSYTYSAASVDPLGNQVRTLRMQSSSLKIFLQTASGLSSRQELAKLLAGRD